MHTIRTLPELIHDDKKGEDLDTEGEDHPADAQRYEKIHLNWIDGFAGSIITNQLPIQSKSPIIIEHGKQQPMDMDPWERVIQQGNTRVIGE